ncbi:uncharacterized protein EI97DRAFT_503223 [Westerdykella ornata]|uniref:Ras modification protein ERF4 n=1 Tax=Westerdykella ornata TaxID=318751 RepID=A0A6A6JDW4_WESOR|nr:uncharacterized protein EI97DRAFT_503223 [Westerdykella ornata]KAF2273836.1 hypothetical protein EI97DRAFT_503223 [Westerdykella ornata]
MDGTCRVASAWRRCSALEKRPTPHYEGLLLFRLLSQSTTHAVRVPHNAPLSLEQNPRCTPHHYCEGKTAVWLSVSVVGYGGPPVELETLRPVAFAASSASRTPAFNDSAAPDPSIFYPSPTHHPTAYSPSTPPQDPPPVRWSLTNRLFNLNFRSLYSSNTPRRPPASRLWNPVNSSPRTLALPYVPVEHPQLSDPRPQTRDEYPLLTLPEQRRSRQSPVPSSLFVERSVGGESGRTSIGLPRDRRSPIDPHPGPSRPNMSMAHESAPPNAPHDAALPVSVSRTGDVEAGTRSLKTTRDRSHLPGSRPHSMYSQRTGTAEGDHHDDHDDASSEVPWGPKHPCFPHRNPHVPLDSPLYQTTRIIRVTRDWMVKGDLAPTFQNLYPEVLDPMIEEDEFRRLIEHINTVLIDAFNPLTFRAFLDAFMGAATLWLWDDVGLTKVKRKLAELERWIENWNRERGEKEGVKIIPLRRTGYMTIDIQVPDPELPGQPGESPPSQADADGSAPQQQPLPGQTPITPTFQITSGSPVSAEARS